MRLDFHRRDLMAGLGSAAVFRGASAPFAQDYSVDTFDLGRQFLTRLGAELTLNGQYRRTFLIDTGAAATSVADTLAEELALPPLDPVLVHGTTGAEVMPSVSLDRLLLRGQVFRDLRCPVFKRTDLGADGLLGLDVLGRFRLSFDMLRRQASLDARRTRADVGATRGPTGQLIVTPIRVNGHEATAFIDSGSQPSVGNRALMSAIGAVGDAGAALPRSVSVHGVAGRAVDSEQGVISRLEIGDGRLDDVPVLFADLYCFEALGIDKGPAMLVGADILTRFRWVTMDFTRNTLRLESPR